MNKILYLPLDERPCNYIFPQYVAKIANAEILCPPIQLMGNFKIAADVDGLWHWLFDNASSVSHIVLSADLMLYGGIVPSRLHDISDEMRLERISQIKKIKIFFPSIHLYVFGLITRAPAYSSSDEEPDYYAEYGSEINRYGVISDMQAVGDATSELLAEKARLETFIPTEFLSDFAQRRRANFASHLKLIDYLSNGVIDHLIIPLDDCKEYGWASGERRRLASYAAKQNVLSRVGMYPGADEVGCTLIARAICDINAATPQVWLEYSSQTGKTTIPPYEDRSIGETAPYHVLNCGGQVALSTNNADCVIMVNAPTQFSKRIESQLDRREIHMENERNLPLFISKIRQFISHEVPCFIADCAVPNGADQCLMQFLKEQELLFKINGYSGWNTSSNAMGTIVAFAIAYTIAKAKGLLNEDAASEFRLLRYVEDWGYMTHVRRELTDILSSFGEGLSYFTLADKGETVAKTVSEMLTSFMHEHICQGEQMVIAYMPWNRMFEIDLKIE